MTSGGADVSGPAFSLHGQIDRALRTTTEWEAINIAPSVYKMEILWLHF